MERWYMIHVIILTAGIAGYLISHEIFAAPQAQMTEACQNACGIHGVQSFSIDPSGNPICSCR